MQTNKKVLVIVFSILSLLSIAIISNVWVHFINFGNKTTIDKANSIAESVRDGLTAHMVHGVIKEKSMFLRNMIKHQNVKTLRVIRSKKNMEQFQDTKIKYASYDKIEKKVLATGKIITRVEDNYLRITIPYIAISEGEPNCLSCHTKVNEGDVLGAITLELNIDEVKQNTYKTIIAIVSISILFLFISYLIALYFIKPYIKLFDDLEEGITRAYKGDFSQKVITDLTNDAGRVAHRLNDLTEIFKFKKTIELDAEKNTIYERLAYILKTNFRIEEFFIFENKIDDKSRKIVYQSSTLKATEESKNMETSKEICRAFRTGNNVDSTDFHKVCKLCYRENKKSLCLPFSISNDVSLTLLIYVNTEDELDRIRKLIPIISNYFELAEPVLQTKILMKQLHSTTLVDPLTGLYNRRFLDTYIKEEIHKQELYSLMMIDIDLFKQVNDAYGHNIGDNVLKTISQILINNLKGSDYAIRYGGEEFLLITFGTTHKNALKIAENIRTEFSQKVFKADKESFKKTLSIGISNYPDDSSSVWQCIKFADIALYKAKETGRNKVVLFEPSLYQEDNT